MKLEGYDVTPSKKKNKKYDVYKDNKFVVSFGYKGMGQYRDQIGHYKNLDHNDEQRRKNFKSRFKQLIAQNDKTKPTYWANKYLW